MTAYAELTGLMPSELFASSEPTAAIAESEPQPERDCPECPHDWIEHRACIAPDAYEEGVDCGCTRQPDPVGWMGADGRLRSYREVWDGGYASAVAERARQDAVATSAASTATVEGSALTARVTALESDLAAAVASLSLLADSAHARQLDCAALWKRVQAIEQSDIADLIAALKEDRPTALEEVAAAPDAYGRAYRLGFAACALAAISDWPGTYLSHDDAKHMMTLAKAALEPPPWPGQGGGA